MWVIFNRDEASISSRHVGCTAERGSNIRVLASAAIGLCRLMSPVIQAPVRASLVEEFFNEIKQRRCVANRCDKLSANYLAFIGFASIRLWLRVNESAP
jgi:hypothetical protein